MIIFEWLNNWIEQNKQILEQEGLVFSQLKKDAMRHSQYFDIEAKYNVASIMLWESGECDVLIINLKTQEEFWFEYQIIKSKDELGERIERAIAKL